MTYLSCNLGSTAHGPQNHRAHLEKLLEYVEVGIKEGAKLVYGGYQVKRPGLFFMPTIFTNVEDHMFIAQEESFGPIMIISTFSNGDLKEVLERSNATEFGLASGVFTKDMAKALAFADGIHAGTCFINCYNKVIFLLFQCAILFPIFFSCFTFTFLLNAHHLLTF